MRNKPRAINTVLSVVVPFEQRLELEDFATKNRLSLSEASRYLMSVGAKALEIDSSKAFTQ